MEPLLWYFFFPRASLQALISFLGRPVFFSCTFFFTSWPASQNWVLCSCESHNKWNEVEGLEQLSFSFCYNSALRATQERRHDCLTWMKRLGEGPWRGHYRENLKVTVMKGSRSSEVSASESKRATHPWVGFPWLCAHPQGYPDKLWRATTRRTWLTLGALEGRRCTWRCNNETHPIVRVLSSTAGGMCSWGWWLKIR